ncbi:glycosyl hydrolase family 65 protein [Mycobacterium gallinarum]
MALSPNWPNRLVHSAFSIRCRGHHMYVRVSGKGREATVVAR